jgi:tight adherence protein B
MHPVGLTSCCAAVLAWLLFQPAPAGLRLRRLLASQGVHEQGVRERLSGLMVATLETFRERRRMQQRWRSAVIELCDGMASELAAGRTPDEAFTITAALLDPTIATRLLDGAPSHPPKKPEPTHHENSAGNPRVTAVAAPYQKSPTDPLRFLELPAPSQTEMAAGTRAPDVRPPPRECLEELAKQPGAEGLRLLAACWRIAAEQGGTLAVVLDDLAAALRDEEANRQEIATQLAGPRATARLLSGLPLLGLAMAAALGANPLAFLIGTLPGLGCLFAGIALNVTGLWWTHRLAKGAEELS